MRTVDLFVTTLDVPNRVSVLDLKQKPRRSVGMAGDRGGRRSKGLRHPTMVRVPMDHYRHYTEQAEAFGVPMSDFIAYRIALCEGLEIPDEALLANPALLGMLPEDLRDVTMRKYAGLAARYEAFLRTRQRQTEQLEMQVA